MSTRLDNLDRALRAALGAAVRQLQRDRGELTLSVAATDYAAAARTLRDGFERHAAALAARASALRGPRAGGAPGR